jgi:hypothetical protein
MDFGITSSSYLALVDEYDLKSPCNSAQKNQNVSWLQITTATIAVYPLKTLKEILFYGIYVLNARYNQGYNVD